MRTFHLVTGISDICENVLLFFWRYELFEDLLNKSGERDKIEPSILNILWGHFVLCLWEIIICNCHHLFS